MYGLIFGRKKAHLFEYADDVIIWLLRPTMLRVSDITQQKWYGWLQDIKYYFKVSAQGFRTFDSRHFSGIPEWFFGGFGYLQLVPLCKCNLVQLDSL